VRFFRAANGLAWIAALGLSCQLFAQEQDKRSSFKDPEDGKLDASEWLLDRKGFLPVPILITEPAVGYGAGAALLFFRESIGDAVTKANYTDAGFVYASYSDNPFRKNPIVWSK